jgi:heme oxygenase
VNELSAAQQLKRATSSAHSKLDQHPLLKALPQNGLSELEYGSVLLAIEHWLALYLPYQLTHPNLSLQNRALQRHRWLLEDLKSLQIEQQRYTVQTRPSLPNNLAQTLGAIYVIEGSSMGGLFLAPRVESELDRVDVTRFYRGYGKETASLWRETQSIINSELTTQSEIVQAIAAANQLFDSMYQILEKVFNERFALPGAANE